MFFGILAVIVFLYWLFMLVVSARGLRLVPRLPVLKQPTPDEPFVSVIVAAKDEEESIGRTLANLLALDYPHYEVIVVNDRSEDGTREQIEAVKRWAEETGKQVPLHIVHIQVLPDGWLGKNHALYQGYLHAKGDYLLFTDADVVFAPHTLRSAMAYLLQQQADHVTLTPAMISKGFWLRAFVNFFLFALCMFKWPWKPNDDRQHREGMGVGAFNFLTREAYEKIGTHQAISLRPDDDLMLGMRVKQARLRQRVVTGQDHLEVEWYPSLRAAIRGLEKNMFAGLKYQLSQVVLAVVGQLLMFFLPFVAFWWFGDWRSLLFLLSSLFAIVLYLSYAGTINRDRGLDVLVMPLTVLLFLFVLLRSTYLTLRQGGIYWRGTFYSLRELKSMNEQ